MQQDHWVSLKTDKTTCCDAPAEWTVGGVLRCTHCGEAITAYLGTVNTEGGLVACTVPVSK